MTKVEHTKIHQITTFYPDTVRQDLVPIKENVLVTEAKLVLVEDRLLTLPHTKGSVKVGYKIFNPILISETEKIEVGDWVCAKKSKGLRYVTKLSGFSNQFEDDGLISKQEPSPHCHIENYYKILALPEHFSPQQLQMIVDGKLKDGDKVLVECEFIEQLGISTYIIHLNPHITIYPVEEKMVPLSLAITAVQIAYTNGRCNGSFVEEQWREWFEQNVK